jgi:exonuclease VII large subunit
METGQQTLLYHFDTEVDLTYKADAFTSRLEKLDNMAMNLNQVVKNEFQNSEGKIIKEAIKAMEKQTEENRQYYNASSTTMKNMAARYTDIVNDMNRQKLTLYYDIIEMES